MAAVRHYAGRGSVQRRGVSACQFDSSHEQVENGGKPLTVKVVHVRFYHSRHFHIRANSPRPGKWCSTFTPVPSKRSTVTRRGIYDNVKTAVETVFTDKARRFNRLSEQICSHYLIEPIACTRAW